MRPPSDQGELVIPREMVLRLFKPHLMHQRLRMEGQMKQPPKENWNPFPIEERNTMPTQAPVPPDCPNKSNWLRANSPKDPETLSISVSLLSQFKPVSGTPERLGQQAYNFFGLGKLQSPENKAWADRLWESDGDLTRTMLTKVVDYNN